MNLQAQVATAFEEHRRFLWGLAYRMTGCAADADDVVQESFLRAMDHPPADRESSWRPWLVRVAVNLAKDLLRRRRRATYPGLWLPSPVPEEALLEPPPQEALEQRDRSSYAFMVALESLTPQQRAVLLLREVAEFDGPATAKALGLGESNVKVTLHRARRALASRGPLPGRVSKQAAEQALHRFIGALEKGDAEAVKVLLAEDAVAMGDTGGLLPTSRVPLRGGGLIATFFLHLAKQRPLLRVRVTELNGMPALLGEVEEAGRALPLVLRVDLDAQGRIVAVHSILAPGKLSAVRF